MKKRSTKLQSQEPNINEMVTKVLLERQDWKKHLKHTCCKCQKCTCGKHLCKFSNLKLQLNPTKTTYRRDYVEKQFIKNQRIDKPQEKNRKKQVYQKSTYRVDYPPKKSESMQRGKKKEGNLQLGGPLFSDTAYKDFFQKRNFSQPPKLMKNLDSIPSSGLKMKTSSLYRTSFQGKHGNPQSPCCKKQDNIKSHYIPFSSGTSYQNDYITFGKKSDKNDNFAPKNNYKPTRGVSAKSSYRTDYYKKQSTICPAQYCC